MAKLASNLSLSIHSLPEDDRYDTDAASAGKVYRMFVPKRYGGLEVDVPTFMRVTAEIARGCPSTAWCLALASNHALMVGSWFPEQTQDEVFGDGRFVCASVASPLTEVATPTEDGWELNGKVAFCLT